MKETAALKTGKVDSLNVQIYPSRQAMGAAAGAAVARRIRTLQQTKSQVSAIFGSAPSQNELLDAVCREPGIDWSRIRVFHMDEYIGLSPDAPQKFSRYLEEHLVDRVQPGHFFPIESDGDPQAECDRHAALLAEQPIDIVCLGIGENGHIAFNDPHVAFFDDPEAVKIVEIDELCRRQQVNDGCFPHMEHVPKRAITLTIPTLMSGAHLFCVVPGPTKRLAVHRTLHGPITPECPASILRRHPGCTLYLDPEASGEAM